MKKFGKPLFLILIGAVFLTLLHWGYLPCIGEDCISKKDENFSALVRMELKEKNQAIKISDIYPGNWQEVCVLSGGNANAKYLITDDVKKFDDIVILNGSPPYSTDQISLVAFLYSASVMEVFRSKELYLSFGVSKALVNKKRGCLERRDAYFRMTGMYAIKGGDYHIDVQLVSGAEL